MSNRVTNALHNNAGELGDALVRLVQDKTPVLTGALQSDITWAPMTGNDILQVYANAEAQSENWGRVYVQYQEGPPMGVPTYTNPPRLMFLDTANTDGFIVTEAWAIVTVQEALNTFFP